MEAIDWVAKRSPREVEGEREKILAQIESAGQEFWRNGSCKRWLKGADAKIKEVAPAHITPC